MRHACVAVAAAALLMLCAAGPAAVQCPTTEFFITGVQGCSNPNTYNLWIFICLLRMGG